MSRTDYLPAPTEGDALASLLKRAVRYEKAGGVIPLSLMQFGLLGSIVVIMTGLLALVLPGPASISHGGFFLVFGGIAASLDSVLGALAVPAILSGIALLGLDIYLMKVRTSEHSRHVVVAQAAAGAASGAIGSLFLALLLLNLVIWIVIMAAMALILGAVLAGWANG